MCEDGMTGCSSTQAEVAQNHLRSNAFGLVQLLLLVLISLDVFTKYNGALFKQLQAL